MDLHQALSILGVNANSDFDEIEQNYEEKVDGLKISMQMTEDNLQKEDITTQLQQLKNAFDFFCLGEVIDRENESGGGSIIILS